MKVGSVGSISYSGYPRVRPMVDSYETEERRVNTFSFCNVLDTEVNKKTKQEREKKKSAKISKIGR